jgi:hypothetical protein
MTVISSSSTSKAYVFCKPQLLLAWIPTGCLAASMARPDTAVILHIPELAAVGIYCSSKMPQ